ncbi:unnamed protein product [Malus baccata var. baccata]
MAITGSICSSPNQHPTLPTLPLPPIPPLKTHHPLQVSNDALVIAAVAEPLALTRAAVEVARDAAAVRDETVEASSCRESGMGVEGARLELRRLRVVEAEEQEPTSKQLAKAMGMKTRSIDKVLCKKRESQERIIRSCRGLIISEGSDGLVQGAEKFDHERGWKLSTYVYWWIRQAIIRALDNKSRIIRLPWLPTHDEIAEVVNVPAATVKLVCDRSRPPISLAAQTVMESASEIMQGPEEMMPEKMLTKQLMKQDEKKLLKTLSDAAYVLRLHFGLNGETPKSFEEIGRLLKL